MSIKMFENIFLIILITSISPYSYATETFTPTVTPTITPTPVMAPCYLTKWGTYGTGAGEFDNPGGIAIDSLEYIYIADSNNDRIQKFNSNGNFIKQWGAQGGAFGEFQTTAGITIDTSDNVYVVDSGNNRIQKFTSNGVYFYGLVELDQQTENLMAHRELQLIPQVIFML